MISQRNHIQENVQIIKINVRFDSIDQHDIYILSKMYIKYIESRYHSIEFMMAFSNVTAVLLNIGILQNLSKNYAYVLEAFYAN